MENQNAKNISMTGGKNYLDLGGTLRSCRPFETLAMVEPLLDRFGITRVANVGGLDNLNVPVAICIRPNAKHLSVSQGKGISWELAKASAIMESIEGYHAENSREPDLHGSYAELTQEFPLIDPKLFNAGFFQITEFDNLPLDWISAFDLVNDKKVFIPHILLSLDSSFPRPEYGFIAVNSNGLASGNTLAEAILHGICELIERDSLFHWRQLPSEERNNTQIRLETISPGTNRKLLDDFAAAGLQVKIWDASQKIGVPVFQCAVQESNVLRELGTFYGSGAHLSREVALSRALTEAAQSRLTLITGSRDDVFIEHYQRQNKTANHDAELAGKREFSLCPSPEMPLSFEAAVDELVALLAQNGFQQILTVDHTKPEFNIPVVHVFIPGMRYGGSRI